jgi:hypothetical protein
MQAKSITALMCVALVGDVCRTVVLQDDSVTPHVTAAANAVAVSDSNREIKEVAAAARRAPQDSSGYVARASLLRWQKQSSDALAMFNKAHAFGVMDSPKLGAENMGTLIDRQRNSVVRYDPDPSTSPYGSLMKVSVARTDLGETYNLNVQLTVPDVALPDLRYERIDVSGLRFQNRNITDRFSLPSVTGHWNPGQRIGFVVSLGKDRSKASDGWILRFCIGTSDQCLPGPNLLAGAPSAAP